MPPRFLKSHNPSGSTLEKPLAFSLKLWFDLSAWSEALIQAKLDILRTAQNLPSRAILSSMTTQAREWRQTWLPSKVQVVSWITFAKLRNMISHHLFRVHINELVIPLSYLRDLWSIGGSLNTWQSLMTKTRVQVTVILEVKKLMPGFHTRSTVPGVNRMSLESVGYSH